MEIARTWRAQASNLKMAGSRCRACGTLIFPERVRCSSCRSADLAPFCFAGGGELLSVTTVREAPQGFAAQVPYLAGLVRLDEGPVIAVQLTDVDPEDAVVGMRLSMVTRRIRTDGDEGPIVYGYKFMPEGLDEPDRSSP